MKTAGKLLAASFELFFLLSHDKRKAFRLVDLKQKKREVFRYESLHSNRVLSDVREECSVL
jgi:hypothetical protein